MQDAHTIARPSPSRGHVRLDRCAVILGASCPFDAHHIALLLIMQLMLVAMTYNTYLFGSIVLGSFIGHVMYEAEIDIGQVLPLGRSHFVDDFRLLAGGQKGLACH